MLPGFNGDKHVASRQLGGTKKPKCRLRKRPAACTESSLASGSDQTATKKEPATAAEPLQPCKRRSRWPRNTLAFSGDVLITVNTKSGRSANVQAKGSWLLPAVLSALPESLNDSEELGRRCLLLEGRELRGKLTLAQLGVTAGAQLLLLRSPVPAFITCSDSSVRVWDGGACRVLARRGMGAALVYAELSPDSRRLLTRCWGVTAAEVLCSASGGRRVVLAGHEGKVTCAKFSPDGRVVMTTSEDCTARLWCAASGECLATLLGHEAAVREAQFSPDGTMAVTVAGDDCPRVWRVEDGKFLCSIDANLHAPLEEDERDLYDDSYSSVRSAAFSPDGKVVMTVDNSASAVKMWLSTSGKRVSFRLRPGLGGCGGRAQFSPDGSMLLSGLEDDWLDQAAAATVKIWSAATGLILQSLKHTEKVSSEAFSPDSELVLTICGDRAMMWCAETGRCLRTLAGHERGCLMGSFSQDNRCVLTAAADGMVKLWCAEAGECLLKVRAGTPSDEDGDEQGERPRQVAFLQHRW